MEATKTLIFMDLESTGLFDDSYSDPLINPGPPKDLTRRLENIIRSDGRQKPHITEISLISIPSKLFKEASQQLNKELNIRNNQLVDFFIPVITNIQTRQINPKLNSTEWANYELLRMNKPNVIQLRREDLELKNTFAEEWPGFVYFLDTLSTLPDIENSFDNEVEITTRNVNWKYIISQNEGEEEEENEEEEIDNNEGTTNNLENLIRAPPTEEQLQKTPDFNKKQNENKEIGRKGAKRCIFGSSASLPTPVTFMRTESWSPAKRRRINSQYFGRNREGNWDFNSHQAKRETVGRGKRTLLALQERFFVTGLFSSHRAQGDAEALLQCCLAYGDDFLSYMDKNRAAFPIESFRENVNYF
uniref:Exonuclease domain-containing protein n=1 Tax=Meloidogyne floridensis TaxID=298350 RepID=A0A915PEC4_9BILA